MDQQYSLDHILNKMLLLAAEIGEEFNRGNAVGFPEERKHRIQQLYEKGVSLYRPAFDHLIDEYCKEKKVSRSFLNLKSQSEE